MVFGFADVETGLAFALILVIFFIWLGERFDTGAGSILGGVTIMLLAFELNVETGEFALPLLVVGAGALLIAYGAFRATKRFRKSR